MEKPDLTVIHEMGGGDKEFEATMIEIMQREFPKEKEIFYDTLKQNDLKQTAQIVHKLKHKISLLNMHESYKFSMVFEEELKAGNKKSVKKFEDILDTITLYLKELAP